MRDFHAECVKFSRLAAEKHRKSTKIRVGTGYAVDYSNPVGSGFYGRKML